jgi:hypothetical protein
MSLRRYFFTLVVQIWIPAALAQAIDFKQPALRNTPKPAMRFSSTGSVGIEAYQTNFQSPRLLNQPSYIRLTTRQTFNLGIIPIGLEGFATTEPQSVYSSNYLRFYFDREAYKAAIQKKRQSAMSQLQQQAALSKAELEKQKRYLADLEARAETAEQELAKSKERLAEKQNTWGQFTSAHIIRSNVPDSTGLQLKRMLNQRAADSMAIEYLIRDTQQLHQYLKAGSEKKAKYSAAVQKLDSAFTHDTALLGQARRSIRGFDGGIEQSAQNMVGSRAERLFAGVTQFQVGSAQVLIHPYSLNGTSMRGINAGYSFGNTEVEIAAGAIQSVGLFQFDRNRIPFDRPAVALKVTTQLSALKIGTFGHIVRDLPEKAAKNNHEAFSNAVFGVFAEGTLGKNTNVELSAATATFSVQSTRVRQVIYSGPATVRRTGFENKAYRIRLEQQLSKRLSSEITAQMAGPAFRNLGNPFMRSRFEEQALKLKGATLSGQLLLSGFYKRFNDNPGKLQEITNASQGYGISIQTRFKKRWLPNFNFSITPYEQGNNHPDTLLRVNSRFNMTMAGASWRVQRGRFKYSVHALGTQSSMALTDTQRINMRTLTMQQDLQAGKGFNAGVTATFSRSVPGVDSTQSNIWQVRAGWSGSFGQLTVLGHYAQFLNGAYRKGVALNYGIMARKNLRLSMKLGYDHYYRMWGLEREIALSGLFKAEIRW